MPSGGQNKIPKTRETELAILASLKQGTTLTKTVKNLGISVDVVDDWRNEDPNFAAECIRAEACGASVRVDDAYELIEREEDVNRLRVHLNFIQWEVSKRNPHVFGDRINIDVTNKIDLSNVLTAAEQRARLAGRHGRDMADAVDAEIVETKQLNYKRTPAAIAVEAEKPNDSETPKVFDPLGILE